MAFPNDNRLHTGTSGTAGNYITGTGRGWQQNSDIIPALIRFNLQGPFRRQQTKDFVYINMERNISFQLQFPVSFSNDGSLKGK